MYRYYGKVYKVFIELNKSILKTEEEIKTFIKENIVSEYYYKNKTKEKVYINEIKVIRLKDNKLELLWEVPENEGVHEIEISLYYTLEDDKYGTYDWTYVRWEYEAIKINVKT